MIPQHLLWLSLFLLIISALWHYSKNTPIPAVVWIFLFGISYGILNYYSPLSKFDLPSINLSPEIILNVFLPILIYDSARKLKFKKLYTVWLEAGVLATIGVLISSAVLGLLFALITGIPLTHGLIFGVALSPTDPIAISAICKDFKLSQRLNTLIESESLLNDAVAILLFTSIVSFTISNKPLGFSDSFISLTILIIGAIIWGLFTGYICLQFLRWWKGLHELVSGAILPLICIYVTFVVGEHFLAVSGVIAVMCASMVISSIQFQSKKHHDDILPQLEGIWTFIADLAYAFIFFNLGLRIAEHIFEPIWHIVPWIVLSLILARAISVYAIGGAFNQFKIKIPNTWLMVLNFGGLKGALSIALITLIPEDYPHKNLFLCGAFALAAFTLIVNVLGLRWYLSRNKQL